MAKRQLPEVEQVMLSVLEHAISLPPKRWHDMGSNTVVREAIQRLAQRGAVEIDAATQKYRLRSNDAGSTHHYH
jgi:hypothetical protein